MNYYKLINERNIVGVVSLNDFRRYQAKHGLVLFSDIEDAQYVEFRGVYYRDDWLRATITENVSYEQVSIIMIDKLEYDALIEAMKKHDEIVIAPDLPPIEKPEPSISEEESVTIEFLKSSKIEPSRAAAGTFSPLEVYEGDTGNSVLLLQRLLRGLGYRDADKKALVRDGQAGEKTIYALKRFQKKKKLEVDGICGPLTWKALLDL